MSSLPLQMSLYFNIVYFPFWLYTFLSLISFKVSNIRGKFIVKLLMYKYNIFTFNLFLVELFKHVDPNYNLRVIIFDIDSRMRSIVLGCSRKSR